MRVMDMDFAEQQIGKGHRVMTPDDLLDYALLWTEKLFGHPVTVEEYIDLKRCKSFKKMYGGDAGLIMKWFFVARNGLSDKQKKFKFTMLTGYYRNMLETYLEEARNEMEREKESLMGGRDGFASASQLADALRQQAS